MSSRLLPRLASSLAGLGRAFGDFLFPPLCFGCDAETGGGLVCDSCRSFLFVSELGSCPRCGRPRADAQRPCPDCDIPLRLKRVRAVGLFAPPLRGLVHALKYREKTALAPVLGAALAVLSTQDDLLRTADCVCAVPLHPARRRERGYNQSELLAHVVAGLGGVEHLEPLVRQKNTRTQTEMASPAKRRENIAGAFRLADGAAVAGRRVIIVDDVCTSGATLDEAAAVLLGAGAAEVYGLVIAAADPKDDQSGRRASRAGRRRLRGRRASPAPAAVD